jgi:hypothetical protein
MKLTTTPLHVLWRPQETTLRFLHRTALASIAATLVCNVARLKRAVQIEGMFSLRILLRSFEVFELRRR